MFTTKNIVIAGLMTALVTVGTMIIKMPVGIGGYVHLGDSMVYLSGIVLGPVLGGLTAGLGSFLADMLSGYAFYAVPTFIIKALDALVVALIYKLISGKGALFARKVTAYVIAFIGGTVVMVSGYFLFETVAYGMGGAMASLFPNIFQGIVGGLISIPFFILFTESALSYVVKQK